MEESSNARMVSIMKLIIAGSRKFTANYYYHYIDIYINEVIGADNVKMVLCGEAKGIDTHGKKWALKNNIEVKSYPADWDKHGKLAGPLRNKEMASQATHLLLVWDGKSKGSKNMLNEAEKAGLIIHNIDLNHLPNNPN